MTERRRKLQAAVQAERDKITDAQESRSTPSTLLAWGKHFVVETQFDDEGEPVYAIYRVTDWMSTGDEAQDELPPIHRFDLANDAMVAISVLDTLVEKIEAEGAEPVTLPQIPTNNATQNIQQENKTQ